MKTQKELQFMLPQFPYTLTPRDMLDYRLALSWHAFLTVEVYQNLLAEV